MKKENTFQGLTSLLAVVVLLLGCTKSGLECALDAAGGNRAELEKVLAYYAAEKDFLKKKAACYLIENMLGHATCTNDVYEAYCRSVDSLGWESEKTAFAKLIPLYAGEDFVSSLDSYDDVCHISSSYLIRHIDYVFKLRDTLPWLQQLDFNDFCEYVLPYRILNERPIDWEETSRSLKAYLGSYLTDFDDLKYSIDFLTADLTERLKLRQSYALSLPRKGMHYFDCMDNAYRELLYYKLLGIPVSWDYVPFWANADGGHYWAAPFDPLQRTHSDYWDLKHRAPKIYRKSYARQVASVLSSDEYIPPFFRQTRYRDVTDEYMNTSDIKIEGARKTKTFYTYLAVFNSREWQAVAQSRNGLFEKMGRGVVYLPVAYTKIGQQILSYPFVLNEYGQILTLKPDTMALQTMVLKRKFPYDSRKEIFNYWGEGTVVLGANDPQFQDPDTIHVVEGNTGMGYQHWQVPQGKSYRYFCLHPVRYIEVAELEFYDCAGKQIPIKLNGMDKNLQAATDGDILSYSTIRWGADIDLGTSLPLSGIRYLGRNDGNNVFAGDEYELLYMSENGWVSMGKKEATGESISFEQVPSGALYWLRNRSRGKEERIFTYTNGHVKFW